jgi:hypothetical protein
MSVNKIAMQHGNTIFWSLGGGGGGVTVGHTVVVGGGGGGHCWTHSGSGNSKTLVI